MHVCCPACESRIECLEFDGFSSISCPSCGSDFSLVDETVEQNATGRTIAHFELQEELGVGAFGTVWKARDSQLDRTVAIKLPRENMLGRGDTFLREAQSAAQLKHPNIVSVHEVGRVDGQVYIVSEFVEGVPLSSWLTGRKPAPRESVEICAKLAEAVQHAHDAGVIHRDLKPSNVMLDAGQEPFVMDFGLAKRQVEDMTMTVDGKILGTPAYMSPEQAAGQSHKADGRTDVYSLGVILFEMLTGERPFRGDLKMLIHQVRHEEPPAPRSLNGNLPRDLETICLKAMAKEPDRRYASAQQFAEDLRRWLLGEPIFARPAGRVERTARWIRRHPTPTALVAMSLLAAVLLAGLLVRGIYNQRLTESLQAEGQSRATAEREKLAAETARQAESKQRELAEQRLSQAEKAENAARKQRGLAEHAQRDAEEAVKRLRWSEYKHTIALAHSALRENSIHIAKAELAKSEPKSRGWEWQYLQAQCRQEMWRIEGSDPVLAPDARRMAVVRRKQPAAICDLATGKTIRNLPGVNARSIIFSPDGTRFAAIGSGKLAIYDAENAEKLFDLPADEEFYKSKFSPDGRLLAATLVKQNGVCVFELQSKKLLSRTKKYGNPIFDHDGKRMALVSFRGGGTFPILETETGREIRQIPNLAGSQIPQDWSCVLGVDRDRRVKALDLETGKPIFSLRPAALTLVPQLSSTERFFAVSWPDGNIGIHELTTGKQIQLIERPNQTASLASFSPDDSRLVLSRPGDGIVRSYDIRTGREEGVFRAEHHLGNSIFTPDGSRVVIEARNSQHVYVYDATRKDLATVLKGVHHPSFSPDSGQLAAIDSRGGLFIFDLQTLQPTLTIGGRQAHAGPGFQYVHFSPDGKAVLAAPSSKSGGTVRVFNAADGKQRFALEPPGKNAVAYFNPIFDPEGNRIAVADNQGNLQIFDGSTGEPLLTIPQATQTGEAARTLGGGTGRSYAFSSDGKTIASVSNAKQLNFYDVATGKVRYSLPTASRPPLFDPQGKFFLVRDDEQLEVYRSDSGKKVRTIDVGTISFLQVFDSAGSRIAAADMKGVIRVFDVQNGALQYELKGPSALGPLMFSPAGGRIAVGPLQLLPALGMFGAGDGRIRLFAADRGEELLTLRGPVDCQEPIFSPDSRKIAAVSPEGTVIWEAPTDLALHHTRQRLRWQAGLKAFYNRQVERCSDADNWAGAAASAKWLCRVEPQRAKNHFLYGRLLVRAGRPAKATREFERALENRDSLSGFERLESLCELQRFDDATALATALTEQPNAVWLNWTWLALLKLKETGQADYAKVCQDLLIRFGKPTIKRVANDVAWTCALAPGALDDYTHVEKLARLVVATDPADHNARNTLGGVLLRSGKHQEAITELSKSVDMNPAGGHEADFLLLAMAHHHKQESQQADAWRNRAAQREAIESYGCYQRLMMELIRAECDAMIASNSRPDPAK